MSIPARMGAFEFVVLASLRTAQLMRGCIARVPTAHKHAVTAQREVSAGKVLNTGRPPAAAGVSRGALP